MSVSYSPGEWTAQVRQRVRRALFDREISASTVAGLAGWSQSYLARRLRSRQPVPFSVADLESIARVLEMDPAELTPSRQDAVA